MAEHTKYYKELAETVAAMTAPGKGLLAADESTGTIGKRFADIKVENNEKNRQAYRQLLFTAPDWGKYCSGVILYEETLYQKHEDGTPFVDIIKKAGVVPGIKVDKGPIVVPGMKGDTRTQGSDGLDERCKKYYEAGARFAKWRAVYKITDVNPTPQGIQINSDGLACYALICQANGLVPIVEPEVLMDGKHSIERSYEVTLAVLASVFKALHDWGVSMEHMILKPNMVVSGYEHASKASTAQVTEYTLRALRSTVPPNVRGVMFLSGGQSEKEATENLNSMNKAPGPRPWSLSFSYGRALQASALKAWGGKKENIKAGQTAFLKRAKMNYNATLGKYNASDE